MLGVLFNGTMLAVDLTGVGALAKLGVNAGVKLTASAAKAVLNGAVKETIETGITKGLQAAGSLGDNVAVNAQGMGDNLLGELDNLNPKAGANDLARLPGGVADNADDLRYTVGSYGDLTSLAKGTSLDAHHVGQKAVMERLIPGYNAHAAPSILVEQIGHTRKGYSGIITRSRSGGVSNARSLVARDILELRRVYADIPNSALKTLIDMNKIMYPAHF